MCSIEMEYVWEICGKIGASCSHEIKKKARKKQILSGRCRLMIISCVSLGFCPPHPSITEWDLKYVSLLRAVEMYSFTSNFSHLPPQKVALVLFTHSVFRWESVCMPVVWYIWCRPKEKFTNKTKEVNISYANRRVQIYIFLLVLTMFFFFF